MRTIKTTNDWLRAAPRVWGGGPRAALVCASGLTLSVQASANHYCHPREDDAQAYLQVEVGFARRDGKPARVRGLDGRKDGPIWGWVSVEALDRVLRRNGYIVGYALEGREHWL